MSWRVGVLGRAHFLVADELGLTAVCGLFRPDALPPPSAPDAKRCAACVTLYQPDADATGTRAKERHARKRNVAIRDAMSEDPTVTTAALAERFGVEVRTVWLATRGLR